jgi:caffeoyl-CoA O-methyltransferase
MRCRRLALPAALAAAALLASAVPAPRGEDSDRDAAVRKFLEEHRDQWRDENVTGADGLFIRDLIVRHKYTRALEIGTSTGHSGIWIAWAMSMTGGKLVTIEIDEARYEKALANFRAAGLDGFVDADKDWYQNYFKMLLPKLVAGGCFAAHNVLNLEFMHGVKEFLDYARSLPEIETTVERSSASGISLSFKRKLP